MSTQQYDANGNPIFSSSALGSPDQQVADSNGFIVNPAKEDGNLLAIKTQTDQLTFTSSRLIIDGSGVIQPVSGTITANIGTTNGLALDATLTGGTSKVRVLDSAGTAITSTLNGGKQSLDVNLTSPVIATELHVVDSAGDLYTSGSTRGIVLDARVVSSAPTLTAGQFSTPTLSTAGRLFVDGSGVTQPVSGTVTANQGSGNVLTPWAQNLIQISGSTISLGSKTSANSFPVVIASDQSAVPASQSGIWNVRLEDGAGTALTSTLVNSRQALDIHQADTSFIVSGLSATGVAPTLNPISVSGVDGGGLKRHILTDTAGATNIVGRYANGAAGNPNPVVIGGHDDAGNVQTITTDDLIGLEQFLYVTTLPIEADSCNDNTYYSTIVEFTLPSGNTETPFLLIKNPTGTAKKMWVDDMQMDVITKGQQAICRLYHTPTITTNGTAATITNTNIGGGAAASVMQSFTGPTISANGTKLRVFSVGTNSNSTVVPLNYALIMQPNTSILITGTPTANNVVVAFSVRWTEDT